MLHNIFVTVYIIHTVSKTQFKYRATQAHSMFQKAYTGGDRSPHSANHIDDIRVLNLTQNV